MRENVNIVHLYLNIIFMGACKRNIWGFLALRGVLLAVGFAQCFGSGLLSNKNQACGAAVPF